MKYSFEMLPGEHWWGGTVASDQCPLCAASHYHKDFRIECGNQTMPFFVSDEGRFIWSEHPFSVDVDDGIFAMEGDEIALVKAGNSLREAYLSAMSTYFPSDRKTLPEAFFKTCQYNTWMEFTYYPTQEGVLEYAREWLRHGFKPGIFIIDEGWHGRYGDWEFDLARFPNPKVMVDELHEMGFIVMLWIVPLVCADGVNFVRSLRPLVGTDPEEAKHLYMRTKDGEIALVKWWNGYSAILNMANSYDARFLNRQLQHLTQDYGIDGFKFDGGTPQMYNSVVNGVLDTDLSPHELNMAWNEFGRRFTYHEYKDTYKGGGKNCVQRLRDKRHLWQGDGINQLIPCALTAGLIGHPFFCPDMIGGGEWSQKYEPGFEIDEELFVRMAQISSFFPMMQFSMAPWKILSEENIELCLKAATLHEHLSDEIIKLVRASEESGEPILRCLEYNDPHQGFAGITDEFMLGTDILVAPVVTKGQTERKVIFPAGKWKDDKGEIFAGRSEVVLPAPLDTLLWFRKVEE